MNLARTPLLPLENSPSKQFGVIYQPKKMPCARKRREKLRLRNKSIIPNPFAKWLCPARSATLSRVDAFRDLVAWLCSHQKLMPVALWYATQISERTEDPAREPMNGDKLRSKNATRRSLLKTGVGTLAGSAIAAPYVRDAQAATTTTWKVQTSWPAGVGLTTFKTWANSIKEKTGGELELKPFAAKEIVGDFELIDGVRNGVLEAMNSFTLYWAGKVPATAFLSSYLMGLRYPHEWDVFFYGNGGLQIAREVFAKQGLMYVG